MKTQSQLLIELVRIARDAGFQIKETPSAFEFYKDGILLDRFFKFETDCTLSEDTCKRYINNLERHK